MRWLISVMAFWAVLGAAGCSDPAPKSRGVYMLMDTSGTYTKELDKAQQIISYILTRLEPGDSFAVARIDTGSFSEKDIVARVTFDGRPSVANQQKRQFRERIQKFVQGVAPSAFTDITGGLLQAVEFLNEKDPGAKTILVFSDLEEELRKGYVRDIPIDFAGTEVIALNVIKLRSDNIDPRKYLNRLQTWQKRVAAGGGRWRVINDLDRLERVLKG